jgi:hypothetical protein
MISSAAGQRLVSDRIEVDLDVSSFTKLATERGWGDGLPLVPPTEQSVLEMLAGTNRAADQVLAVLPPIGGVCTVEKLAINAAMAGAPPEAMPLLCAAIEAVADPRFELAGINSTTGSVVPALFVNGPIGGELGLPSREGCFGGAAGVAPAIGRALRLVMRNVAGQVVGITSQSVFGQPGRVAGIVVAEWEERSPWAPLAERRGVPGNALTAFGAMGTANIADTASTTGLELLAIIGSSVAFPGVNGFLTACPRSEFLVAINPVWADLIARDIPSIDDVQLVLWEQASRRVDQWPAVHRRAFEAAGRIDAAGLVHLSPDPSAVLVLVCGGTGSLHTTAVHSWGNTAAVTVGVHD